MIKKLIIFLLIIAGAAFTACGDSASEIENTEPAAEIEVLETNLIKETGQIYLYGEVRGSENIIDRLLELWHEYYHNEKMRHLFYQVPHYVAEFLNIWMKSDSGDILDELYADWEGTQLHTPQVKEFFKTIKKEYPETVFHGTDILPGPDTTGARFLEYLEADNMQDSEQYLLTEKTIDQGKTVQETASFDYRVNSMSANFIRAFDRLNGENVMGIYNIAHIYLVADENMIYQLTEHYGDIIYYEDLSWLADAPRD